MGLPPTTPPKLTDRRIQMDAQTRRRERRAEKQAQWKAANPLLVGVSAKPVNRYFGTVTEALELDTAKNGYILLVQDAEPNFDVNGNSPVTPDGWISCSERMPNRRDGKPPPSPELGNEPGQVFAAW